MAKDVWPWTGLFPTNRVGWDGVQGDTTTGTQGTGVGTPKAAAVAATKAGFAGEKHIPKGRMFTMEREEKMLAAGRLETMTREVGSTVSGVGAVPKAHLILIPKHPIGHGMAILFCGGEEPRACSQHCPLSS